MLDRLRQSEQAKYEAVWKIPVYREKCHSLDLWHEHRELFPPRFHSLLDIGCGQGLLLHVLNYRLGYDAHGVDFATNCLNHDIAVVYSHKFHRQCLWDMELGRYFDVGLCDVMEHIPESKVAEVLQRVRKHCGIVIFKIANYMSNSLGYELHPTLHNANWWQSVIAAAGGYVIRNEIKSPHEIYYFTWYT